MSLDVIPNSEFRIIKDTMNFKINPFSFTGFIPAKSSGQRFCRIAPAMLVRNTVTTCGTWQYIWIYRTSKVILDEENEKQQKSKALLQSVLCAVVPFYIIYWYYDFSKKLETKMKKTGMKEDGFSNLILIFAICLRIVAPIMLQSKINDFSDFTASAPADNLTEVANAADKEGALFTDAEKPEQKEAPAPDDIADLKTDAVDSQEDPSSSEAEIPLCHESVAEDIPEDSASDKSDTDSSPAKNNAPAADSKAPHEKTVTDDLSAAKAIRAYKELLDIGAIFPEEYEEKKSVLLRKKQ